MTGLVKLGLGFVAGYSLARALECRVTGVPLDEAFKLDISTLLTPVSKLSMQLAANAAADAQARQPALQPVQPDAIYDPDAPLVPEFAR